jgi:hypothetical protein
MEIGDFLWHTTIDFFVFALLAAYTLNIFGNNLWNAKSGDIFRRTQNSVAALYANTRYIILNFYDVLYPLWRSAPFCVPQEVICFAGGKLRQAIFRSKYHGI